MKTSFTIIRSVIFCGLILIGGQATWAEKETDLFFHNSARYTKVLVKRVLSADKILLDTDERITLIGLKAPEPPRYRDDVERNEYGFVIEKDVPVENSIEDLAFDFARRLMEGKYVRLEFDVNQRDENFTTTAYVFLLDGDVFVNTEILRQGFAELKIRPPNTKYADKLRDAYKEARTEKRGIHNE